MPTSILTDAAVAKISAAAASGDRVRITHIALGDGGGANYQPNRGQAALLREIARLPIETQFLDGDNSWVVTAEFGPETPAFDVREIGFFDEDGDLIAVWAGADVQPRKTGVVSYIVQHALRFGGVAGGVIEVSAPTALALVAEESLRAVRKSAFVAKTGNDALAQSGIHLSAEGERLFTRPFKTIAGASAASLPGDLIEIGPGVWTEEAVLKGGRKYFCHHGTVLADCVFSHDASSSSEGQFEFFGHARVVRTFEARPSFKLEKERGYRLELLGGVHDMNLYSSSSILDINRSGGALVVPFSSTVKRTIFDIDGIWDDEYENEKTAIFAENIVSTNSVRETSSTAAVLIAASRGAEVDLYLSGVMKTAANEAIGIRSLSDPGAAKKTKVTVRSGRIETPGQSFLFVASGADGGSSYDLTLGGGVEVACGGASLTRKQGAPSQTSFAVSGVAVATCGPSDDVGGLSRGSLQIESEV